MFKKSDKNNEPAKELVSVLKELTTELAETKSELKEQKSKAENLALMLSDQKVKAERYKRVLEFGGFDVNNIGQADMMWLDSSLHIFSASMKKHMESYVIPSYEALDDAVLHNYPGGIGSKESHKMHGFISLTMKSLMTHLKNQHHLKL